MLGLQRGFAEELLSRIEDAGLNASAPPQQRWLDGWLVRLSPGKAKRARCVNPLAAGRQPVADKVERCRTLYAAAGLPMWFRITPFSMPADIDEALAALDFTETDDTRVMVCASLAHLKSDSLPAGVEARRLSPRAFADRVGQLRGSSPAQRAAHAQRLQLSPVPYEGWELRRIDDGQTLSLGQFAIEEDLVGIYDVLTPPDQRGRGWARWLCLGLLAQARLAGARIAYLQVDADNEPARAVYRRLGFLDAYGYHYRTEDPFVEG